LSHGHRIIEPMATGTLQLVKDTGTSVNDKITNDAKLTLVGTATGIVFSVDNGASWIASLDLLNQALVDDGAYRVDYGRQSGAAVTRLSPSSSVPTFVFTLDTSVDALDIALKSDSGLWDNDRITNRGEVVLVDPSLVESGAKIEYGMLAAGATVPVWAVTFRAVEGENKVFVRQTDVAGNVSDVWLDFPLDFVLDTHSPVAPTLALSNDTGTSDADLLTSDAGLQLDAVEDNAVLQYSTDGGKKWLDEFTAVVGHNIVKVRQIDEAGNISTVSNALAFVLVDDTTTYSADRALPVVAYSWKTHALLDGVRIQAGQSVQTTAADGSASFNPNGDPSLILLASRSVAADAAAVDKAVNLTDAIAILKMIVGLDVNGNGQAMSPYQSYAADFDGNGKVELSDAISVLKHVVGLSSPMPQWLFLDEADVNLAAKPALAPGKVPQVLATMTAPDPLHQGLVGVLRGDVDASYLGSANAQYLDRPYFDDLSAATGLSLSQFGVYPTP